MSDELTRKELLAEFDSLFRKAHNGYHLDDREFECGIEACEEIYNQIKQLIQQKPEIDEKWIWKKARELTNMTFKPYPVEKAKNYLTQIISDVRGGKIEVDMNFLIMWQKKISKGSGGGHISLRLMKKMLEAIGAKFK